MAEDTVTCKLKIPKDLSDKSPPFLVSFSNGNVNLKCSDKLNFTSFKHVNDKSVINAKRLLLANNGRLNYENSRNVSDVSSPDRNKTRYFVGVRNKSSGKMTVYDAALFHLKPLTRVDVKSSSSSAEKNESFKKRIDDLTASFGSKTKKRSLNAQQKYATDKEPLDDALQNISLNESNNSISTPGTPGVIDYIPPQNRGAGSREEVYDIRDIISEEEDEYLTEKARLLVQDIPSHLPEWRTEGTYCEYILQHLDSSISLTKAKYLIYYHYLVMFSRLLASDIKKKDPASDIPQPVRGYLLDRFTVVSKTDSRIRSFSKMMKDKLLAYMLVLALIIDDYKVNLNSVQNGTKYGVSKVTSIAQVLGCYISRQKVENTAVSFAELKLPLNSLQKYFKKF